MRSDLLYKIDALEKAIAMKKQYFVRMYKIVNISLGGPSVSYADVAILSTSPEEAITRCEEIFGDHLEFVIIDPDTEHTAEWFQVGGGLVAIPQN